MDYPPPLQHSPPALVAKAERCPCGPSCVCTPGNTCGSPACPAAPATRVEYRQVCDGKTCRWVAVTVPAVEAKTTPSAAAPCAAGEAPADQPRRTGPVRRLIRALLDR